LPALRIVPDVLARLAARQEAGGQGVIEEEDKSALTRRRVELMGSLATPLSVEDRIRIQEELRIINAKINDLGQTAAIDAWIDAVLRRSGVKVRRTSDGNLDLLDTPAKWVAIVDALCSGIYAAARGQELPEVTTAPKEKRKRRR
jgi:hypothetical protein